MQIGVEYFIAVSAILFGIGLFGIFTRRSPLILLLSVEIMLNSCNLALISFARMWGQTAGQTFALVVVAVARQRAHLDVDQLTTLKG
jgi:NADH-quinone oxidoreductase subunit K